MNKARTLVDLVKFLHLQRVKGFPPPGDVPFMDRPGVERFRHEVARARSYVEFGSGAARSLSTGWAFRPSVSRTIPITRRPSPRACAADRSRNGLSGWG